MGLENLFEQYTTVPRDHPAQEIERARILESAGEFLFDEISRTRRTNQNTETLDVLLQNGLPFLREGITDVMKNLLDRNRIEQEEYELLTQAQNGSDAPIRQIAKSFSELYCHLSDLIGEIREQDYPRGGFDNQILQMLDVFDGGSKKIRDADKRKDKKHGVWNTITNRLDSIYENCAETHESLHEAVLEYKSKADTLFASPIGQWEDTLLLWNFASEYENLVTDIRNNRRRQVISKEDDATLRDLLEETKARLFERVDPERGSLLSQAADALEKDLQQYNMLFQYTGGTISCDIGRSRDLLTRVERLNEHLAGKEWDVFAQRNRKDDPYKSTIRRTEKLTKEARAQISFLSQHKDTLEHIARVVLGQDTILNPETLSRIARGYLQIYGMHSWDRKRIKGGVYETTDLLGEELLGTVRLQLEEGESLQLESWKRQLEHNEFSEEDEARTKRVQNMVRLVKSKEDAEEGSLYKMISRSREFSNLEEALEEPTALIEARNKVTAIGKIPQLHKAYTYAYAAFTEFNADLEETLSTFSEDVRTSSIINAAVERTQYKLAANLKATARHVTDITEKDPLKRPLKELELETAAMESIQDVLCEHDLSLPEFEKKYELFRQAREQKRGMVAQGIELEEGRYISPDTNVFIADPYCLDGFLDPVVGSDVKVVILQEVLDELDHLKEGKTDVSHLARWASTEIRRWLDADRELPDEERRVHIYDSLHELAEAAAMEEPGSDAEMKLYRLRSARKADYDDAILFGTRRFALREASNRPVILVTRDLNARNRAESSGLTVEEYQRDNIIMNPHLLYTGYRTVAPSDSLASKLLNRDLTDVLLRHVLEEASDKDRVTINYKTDTLLPKENEFFFVDLGDEEHTMILRYRDGGLRPLEWVPAEAKKFPLKHFRNSAVDAIGISPRNPHQAAALELLLDPHVELVTLAGGPGTGKTLLATAAGGAACVDRYDQILYTAPNISVGPEIGYRPGDTKKKLKEVVAQFYDNIKKIPGGEKIPHEIVHLGDIRGRDFFGVYRVLDEAQNTNWAWAKAFVTRHNQAPDSQGIPTTKSVLLGDPDQVDDDRLRHSSGFAHVRIAYLGEIGLPQYGHISFPDTGQRGPIADIGAKNLPVQPGKRYVV